MIKHRSSVRPPAPKRGGAAKALTVFVIVVALAAVAWFVPGIRGAIGEYFAADEDEETSDYILHTADVGPFRITITENGTIDSLRNATMINSVEGSTTIISLVPEGRV